MNTTQPSTPHALSLAENRKIYWLGFERESALVAELIQIEAKGSPSPAAIPIEGAVRKHMIAMLNGSSPPDLFLSPQPPREEQIKIELEAVRRVMRLMTEQREQLERAEAIAFAAAHAEEWRGLCREIMLTATKLFALEQKSRRLLDQKPWHDAHCIGALSMSRHVGYESILGTGEPLSAMTRDAIAEGVVTKSEIKKAENV